MRYRALVPPLALVIGLAVATALAACDNGGDSGAQRTPSSPTLEPTATFAAGEPTAAPTFQGGREPVEGDLPTPGSIAAAELVDVRTGRHLGFDRIVFQFEPPGPHYRVEYVPEATQCASGEAVTLQGTGILQVKFTRAQAHNDQGQPTFGQTNALPGLPAILQATQTCDFEGDLTWVIALPQELDFQVSALEDPLVLVIDVAHP